MSDSFNIELEDIEFDDNEEFKRLFREAVDTVNQIEFEQGERDPDGLSMRGDITFPPAG
ncbi:hypothetical protein P7F60_06150 [Rhizobium sp. YJ-22]|uniref:hypothetical protein n=1 Tax=Rhizobium sp. YJ-22 TaxID=3037556 RepID=UPI0024129237|nr:hypothetical protein [Rhizobium sp. YJ-22]MDG3575957.1 hypothetical protein [Rhizobium sp. YJ-22]